MAEHTKSTTSLKKMLLAVLLCTAAIALDQFTKHAAVMYLKGQPDIPIIPGVFELEYLENQGAAFGIFQNRQWFFVITAFILTLAVLYTYRKMPAGRKFIPLKICAVLLCAGAVGNMIDRIRLNFVVDFFYFSLIDFPVFNVADCYVVTACILFAVLILFFYKDEHDFDWLFTSHGGKA